MKWLFLLTCAVPLCAQEATFSTDVNVHDSDGRVVKDLTRDDFVLLEDGVPQTIRYFSRESNLPLTIGLLVDTSRSQIKVLEPERRASYTFLDQVLWPDKDKAFIPQFNTRVQLIQGFTSARRELEAALNRLEIPPAFATLLYEAVKENSENMMRPEHGRKAFILLSDGVPFRDQTSIGTAIEYAQRADAIIYSILYSSANKVRQRVAVTMNPTLALMPMMHGKGVMRRMARETGGAFFEISATNTIENAYAQIEDALRNQYSLGYTSERAASRAGEYRKITLKVNRAGLIVQARDGYYTQ